METFARFGAAGQMRYGMLHLPQAPATDSAQPPAQGWPSVVMLHDFQACRAGHHRLLVQLSRHLAQRGVASLRFDFGGCGESQGDFSQLTIGSAAQDTLQAGEYLRRQPDIDPQRVMLLGYGMGGLVAALCAQDFEAHRLALCAPALPERWLGLLRGGQVPPVVSDAQGWGLGREFLLELPRLNPLRAARDFGGVARVFVGDQDTLCPPEWSVRYAQALACEAVAIPEADHHFASLQATRQLLEVVGRFILGD